MAYISTQLHKEEAYYQATIQCQEAHHGHTTPTQRLTLGFLPHTNTGTDVQQISTFTSQPHVKHTAGWS